MAGVPQTVPQQEIKTKKTSAWLVSLFFNLLISLVGTAGFEPATPCPPDKYATRLRYAPSLATHVKRELHYYK